MPYYTKGTIVYWLDAGAPVSLLPSGVVLIADSEVPQLIEKPLTPLDQIVLKESQKPFTHRALRELSKTVALMAQAVTGQDPLTNPEVAKIFNLDAEIAALRDQAKVQGLI
jgi:hypothetical protein